MCVHKEWSGVKEQNIDRRMKDLFHQNLHLLCLKFYCQYLMFLILGKSKHRNTVVSCAFFPSANLEKSHIQNIQAKVNAATISFKI